MAKSKSDFTQGSVAGNIMRMALPMTLALLINVLYSVVDRIYIGHMPGDGRLALTGVGVAFPIITIVSAFQNLCSTGGSPLFSIERGKGDDARAELILGNCYCMLVIFGVTLTVIGLAVKAPVLRLIGASDDTFPYANSYLSIYLLGSAFVMTGLGMNPFINAQGFPKIGMLTVLLGAVVNIVLDPIFIFALNLGVRGAALATVIAQMCSSAWVFRFLTGKKAILHLKKENLRLRADVVKRTLSLGLTGFTVAVTNCAVSMVYNASLLRLGSDMYVSVMTVINSIREIIQTPVNGISSGAQPVLSYNYGAGRPERVRRGIMTLTVVVFCYTLVAFALTLIFPHKLIGMFSSDKELAQMGAPLVRIFFCAFIAMAFQIAGQCTFTSLGKVKFAVFFSILRKGIIVIPLVFILPHIIVPAVNGVFWAEPISDVLGSALCYTTMMLTVWRELGRACKAPLRED
jgi:putative MATE family efflux protein